MKRTTVVIFAGLAMAVALAAFGTEVIAPDGTTLSDVLTVPAGDGTTWVRVGLGAPLAIAPNAENNLQLPNLAMAGYLVQDAVSGEPIEKGSLSWQVVGAPDELANATWHDSGGLLDLECRRWRASHLLGAGIRSDRRPRGGGWPTPHGVVATPGSDHHRA